MPRLRQPPQKATVEKTEVLENLEQDQDTLVGEPGPDEGEILVEADQPDYAEENNSLKKQLKELKKSETNLRRQADEQPRQRAEYERQMAARAEELARSQQDARSAQALSIENAIAAATSELEKAQQDYISAGEIADFATQAKAQVAIGKAAARLERLEENKTALASAPKIEVQ